MPKKPRTYISRSSGTRELDRRFYDRYDPHFLFNRAVTVYCLSQEKEKSAEILRSNYDRLVPFITDQYFDALRAELHFLETHQFEAFFALMLAVFQDKPHWVYLTEYRTEDIKTAVNQFIDDDIVALTGGQVIAARDFVTWTIYHRQRPGSDVAEWDTNLDNHVWLLQRMASRYREADEYNAYKHGVRIMTGPACWALGDPDNPIISRQSHDSITYLDVRDVGEGGLTLREVTKHFNPEESFFYLQCMHVMLATMTKLRRASLGDEAVSVDAHTILDHDRNDVLTLGFNNATATVTI